MLAPAYTVVLHVQYRTALKAGTMHVPEAFGVVDGVDPQSMTQLRSLLQGVVQRGTAVGMKKWAKWVGGKTGTTNNNHDAWFAGFNNDIAVIVWVGYDSDYFYKSLGDKRTGGSVAMPIFREIMQSYYRMNPDKLDSTLPDPTETPGIVSAEIEPYTGYIFSDAFKNSCHDMQRRYKVRRHVRTIKEYFVEGSKWNDSKYLFKNQKKSYVAREFLYNNICTPWRQR